MEVVTGAMRSLLPKLGELLMGEYKLPKGVTKKDVESLLGEMRSMYAALNRVAEVPWDQLDQQVKFWADNVRELSYDMEDVIDNFLVRVEGSGPVDDANMVETLMEKMMKLFTEGKTRHQIANAINDMKDRAKVVADHRDGYQVSDVVGDPVSTKNIDHRLLALYKDQKKLIGFEGTRDELTNRLMDSDDKTVSIFGFGGLGKTALAKAVYDTIQAEFDRTAFISVGRNTEVKKVLKDILLNLGKNIGDAATLDEIEVILQELLQNKRYLIVVDDIRNLETWEIIKRVMFDNNSGSRIITTTRILEVARSTSGDVYKLEPLPHNFSEELFYTILFGGKDKCPHDLPVEMSNNFLQKCGGVPLAIITIASLLTGKSMDDWSKVYKSIDLGYGGSTDIEYTRKILAFSYNDLPCYLRSCLLHMSMYPEDSLIIKSTLIGMWIGEGFVEEEPGISLFETGERYFNELINRSMIQPVEQPQDFTIYACRVDNMVFDMICSLSKEQNFVTVLDSNKKHTSLQSNSRRIAVQNRALDHRDPLANTSMPQLRSCYATMSDISMLMLPTFSSFQVLRVLALEDCTFMQDHPYHLKYLGRLLQLRYLRLDNTPVRDLPEEIGDLKFLQVLELRKTKIEELPRSVGLLRNLKRLCATLYGYLIRMPYWIGNLTSLEELNLWYAGESSTLVSELGKLTELRVLSIYFITGFDELSKKILMESLRNLRNLQVLELTISWSSADEAWKGYEPPPQLRELFLSIHFHRLPAWINSSLVPNLTKLNMTVDVVEKQDVVTLGRLPELLNFDPRARMRIPIPAGMEMPEGAFPKLRECKVDTPIRFLEGSMQSLEYVEIEVKLQDIQDGSSDFGSLGNLPSLRSVQARIDCSGAADASDVEEAKAALRQAIETHGNRPTLHIVGESDNDYDDQDASSDEGSDTEERNQDHQSDDDFHYNDEDANTDEDEDANTDEEGSGTEQRHQGQIITLLEAHNHPPDEDDEDEDANTDEDVEDEDANTDDEGSGSEQWHQGQIITLLEAHNHPPDEDEDANTDDDGSGREQRHQGQMIILLEAHNHPPASRRTQISEPAGTPARVPVRRTWRRRPRVTRVDGSADAVAAERRTDDVILLKHRKESLSHHHDDENSERRDQEQSHDVDEGRAVAVAELGSEQAAQQPADEREAEGRSIDAEGRTVNVHPDGPALHITESGEAAATPTPPRVPARRTWTRWACFSCLKFSNSSAVPPASN